MNQQAMNVSRLARAHGLVVLAGAGVSASAPSSLPGWFALNRMIVRALCERAAADLGSSSEAALASLRAMIDERRKQLQFPPDYQAQIIEELCGERYFRALCALQAVEVPNETHRRVAWLAKHGVLRAIVTTNFDELLESCLVQLGVAHRVGHDEPSYAALLADLEAPPEASPPLPVLKVHGSAADHLSLIDTLKQRLRGRNARLDAGLERLLERHYWLLLGFSADDLDSDPTYLRFVPAAPRCPGFTYVRWPGSPDLTSGASKLLAAFEGKQQTPVAECHDFLCDLADALGLPPLPERTDGGRSEPSERLVQRRLDVWAQDLKPIAVINILAALAEANGASELAFYLVHKYWDDPRDRDGPDFTALRLLHGRLGMAQGLLSFTDRNPNTNKHEESWQNLMRVAQGDPRGLAGAALALMWAGQRARALGLLGSADADQPLTPEVSADVFLAMAELFFLACEPEVVMTGWAPVTAAALRAGDLPRASRLIALTALHYAEHAPHALDKLLAQAPVADALQRAQRLNDPAIQAFLNLARGRQAVHARNPALALELLYQAAEAFKAGARPGWRVFACIETSKALLDSNRPGDAKALLDSIDAVVDRYQVWLPWYHDALGQFHHCLGQTEQAIEAFSDGIGYAERMENPRMVKKLQKTLKAVSARKAGVLGPRARSE